MMWLNLRTAADVDLWIMQEFKAADNSKEIPGVVKAVS
jgi:hypothetical protein